MAWWSKYLSYEKHFSKFLQNRSISVLCLTFAFIYFWYGLQKVLGISPAEELVNLATTWFFFDEFVVVLGVWEMTIGIFLLIKPLRRFGLWLLLLKFPGTFLPLFTSPQDCFTIFPYGLTLEGQYIFKNLILIAASLVIIASLHANET